MLGILSETDHDRTETLKFLAPSECFFQDSIGAQPWVNPGAEQLSCFALSTQPLGVPAKSPGRYQREPRDFCIEAKGPMDFVTVADNAVERAIIEMIRDRDPDVAVLGEEAGASGASRDHLWIIDPIDGTANYLRNLPWWSVSIALLERAGPIAGISHAPAGSQSRR